MREAGKNSSTVFDLDKNIYGSAHKHNLYTGLTWRFTDLTNLSTAAIFSFDKYSITPLLSFNHDLFQGAALMISLMIPDVHNVSDSGIFYFNCNARLRLRF